jgi:hypothetical protein
MAGGLGTREGMRASDIDAAHSRTRAASRSYPSVIAPFANWITVRLWRLGRARHRGDGHPNDARAYVRMRSAKHATQQVRGARGRIAADLFFLFGDHGEQTVDGFAGDVVVEIGAGGAALAGSAPLPSYIVAGRLRGPICSNC